MGGREDVILYSSILTILFRLRSFEGNVLLRNDSSQDARLERTYRTDSYFNRKREGERALINPRRLASYRRFDLRLASQWRVFIADRGRKKHVELR